MMETANTYHAQVGVRPVDASTAIERSAHTGVHLVELDVSLMGMEGTAPSASHGAGGLHVAVDGAQFKRKHQSDRRCQDEDDGFEGNGNGDDYSSQQSDISSEAVIEDSLNSRMKKFRISHSPGEIRY